MMNRWVLQTALTLVNKLSETVTFNKLGRPQRLAVTSPVNLF